VILLRDLPSFPADLRGTIRYSVPMIRSIPVFAFGAFFIAASTALSSPVRAQPAPDNGICGGAVAYGEETPLRWMKVAPGLAKVNFVMSRGEKEKAACPAATPACARRAFVMAGDDVLAGPKRGDFVCVSYIAPNAKRVKGKFTETSGFLPAAALQDAEPLPARLSDWFGTWSRDSEAEVVISAGAGGKLKIAGQATFGALDPARAARGAVNSGDFEGEVAPQGNLVAIGEGYDGKKPLNTDDKSECWVKIRLFSRYLAVEDNGACGGMNVSFTGTYVRLN